MTLERVKGSSKKPWWPLKFQRSVEKQGQQITKIIAKLQRTRAASQELSPVAFSHPKFEAIFQEADKIKDDIASDELPTAQAEKLLAAV